jgi:hypothetical protein
MDQVPYDWIITILFVAIIVGLIVRTTVFIPSFYDMNEGFYGGVARSAGHPDCLRTLPEGSQLLDMVASANNVPAGASDASADYKEMELILSKLACLKKDLLSPSGIVEATRTQAFETAHDRMNTGEVCAMCLNQSIAARDLDIIFATWRDRGRVLLRKLCTEANLSEVQSVQVEKLFKKAWEDVYDVATSRCLKTDYSKQNGGSTEGGNVGGVEPPALKDLGTYDYKYGGISASGWNGSV